MVPDVKSGCQVIPELYSVPESAVPSEEVNPGSQQRLPSGRIPFMWAQALFVIVKLLDEELLAIGELDPLNRRMSALKRPAVTVQVVVMARDKECQAVLARNGFDVKTLEEVVGDSIVEVHSGRVLSYLYSFLGRSEKLGMTGRASNEVGILSTSKLYKIQGRLFAFTPQVRLRHGAFIGHDL